MKDNEIYWLNLYNEGKIKIDFEKGIVYSYLSGREHILDNKSNDGYIRISAGPSRKERYSILLHRLIWIVANGEIPDKIEVNHKNGIKNDNRLENLELVTKSEQALHSRRVLGNKGGVVRGEKSGMAKLTWEKVREIRRLYFEEKEVITAIAPKFNVTFATIWDVVSMKTWKDDNHV